MALVVFGLLVTTTVSAADAPRTTTAELVCGHVQLHGQTTSVGHVAPNDGLIWKAQQITLSSQGEAPRPLDAWDVGSESGSESEGLPAIVSSWQCLHGSQQLVIELWFTCNRINLDGVCGGQHEWERLLNLSGEPLDAGYAPQDPRYEVLSKRLGIPVDGLRLQDALGN